MILESPQEFRLPPGPRLPAVIQGALVLSGQLRDRENAHRRFGDAFTVNMPVFGRTVIVVGPTFAKQVFAADPMTLHGGNSPLGWVLGGNSLFSLDEDRHASARKLLMPPLHGERMRSYESLVEEETLNEIASWPERREFESLRPMWRITLNVILRAVFGADDAELAALRRRMPGAVRLGAFLIAVPFMRRDFGPGSPARRFQNHRDEYDRLVDALIAKARADPALERRADVLSLLLQAADERGNPLSRKQIGDHLLSLLIAGHETTGGSLAWTLERLRRHPAILRRLVDEVARGGDELRIATIREVLRTRPVIAGPIRRVIRPFELGEWLLPPGCSIIVGGGLMHNDPRFYDHPERFDPDRFLGHKPDAFTWVPFGGGPRRCIGAAFAQMEMDVVLRTLLQHVELIPTTDRGERRMYHGGTFAPGKGGRVRIRHRPAGPRRAENGRSGMCEPRDPLPHGTP